MKKSITLLFVFSVVLGCAIQAHADLQTIGTATYGGTDYNLIYDNDLQLTWLDYTNAEDNWNNQGGWASGLNTVGVLTYNFITGVSMNWSNNWRLPTTAGGRYAYGYDGTTTGGYNITSSEMGHLFYTELGNLGTLDTSGNPTGCGRDWLGEPSCMASTGDFQNLQSVRYWSGTHENPLFFSTWIFRTENGVHGAVSQSAANYAIAVRSGDVSVVVVPEPISSTLFIVGGAILGFRRFRKRGTI